mgnify:CR=1 FL=1
MREMVQYRQGESRIYCICIAGISERYTESYFGKTGSSDRRKGSGPAIRNCIFGSILFLLAFAVSRFPEHYNMKAIDLGKNMKEEKISEEKEAEGYECSLPVLKSL